MNHDENKLDQLDLGDIRLPPDVLLIVRSQSRNEVIGVHDDMNDGVDEAGEGSMASRQES